MLNSFQRITVETVRNHKGRISIVLDGEGETRISTAFVDKELNHDLAIALQAYYNRQNNK